MLLNIKYYMIGLLFMTMIGQAITYETAEDKRTDRWRVLASSSDGTVKNIYDRSKSSRVISFKGEGTKSAYMLLTNEGASWNNEQEYILHWQMKYSEDFVIIVGLDTEEGKRYLIYTPGEKNGYMQYGLGRESQNGMWHRFHRNLLEDLTRFENHNSINYVESFVIRGNGSIDNVKMMKKHFNQNHETLKKKNLPLHKKVKLKKLKHQNQSRKKITTKPIRKKRVRRPTTNSTPVIILKGDNPLYLKSGEKFVEPGVKATDKEDGEISVNSSENIDSKKEGRYSIIYIATDSQGNSAVNTRYVIIGKVRKNGRTQYQPTPRQNSSVEVYEDEEEEAYQLEERELEISEWEKELEEREKEINEREREMQTSMETQNRF